MYQKCPCNDGLGFITELATAAVSAYAGGAGGAGGSGASPAAPSSPITVSPQISTQISPQISPVFQQQFQPQNSAATAGTSQVLPSMPAMTGEQGGGMIPTGVGTPGYAQPLAPPVPTPPIDYTKYMPYALAGLGLLAFVTLKKRGSKA